ncbi:hypothetical protein [Vibrio vulnificus]|uniref:hypothetical protein n=2 Tax=Vibrio vulnificus TaxID=672 RepID=UPI0009D2FACE|nr:hypothetical protein [Vibrio vulnificus]OQK66518.1 hypothetical protein XM78_c10249 [Vibrio vulnificus]
MPEAAFGNVLTTTDNDESEANSNTDNEVPKTSHGARYPMGPRVREDDSVREQIRTTSNTNNEARKTCHGARYTMGPRVRENDKNKKRKSRAKFSGKEQKTQHTAATPSTVIPAPVRMAIYIEASLDDCLIFPFLITPSIVPLNTIFY